MDTRKTLEVIEVMAQDELTAFVFSTNNSETWSTIKTTLESSLSSLWKEGVLQGAKASDAFQVIVGLGQSMSEKDLLDGIIRVDIKVAIEHPLEFEIITLVQLLAKKE